MFVHNGIGYETLENYATAVKADLNAAFLQIGEHETAFEYDHKIMDDFARELWPDEEGKTWAAGFSLGKLMEMCRDEMNRKNRLNESMKKVVGAAMEWWADPNDSTKTIVTLSDVCDAYSKVYCRGCGIARERCPRIVFGLSALACCQGCSHEHQAIEKRKCGIPVTVPGLRCKNGGCDELSTCGGCFGCKDHCYLAL